MPNINTVALLNNLPGPISATETAIASINAIGGVTTTPATTRATLSLGNDVAGGFFDGRPFKLRVVSQGIASGACNFTVNVYANLGGNSDLITFTNDVLVIGSTGQALASKAGYVFMEATLLWDSVLQGLVGIWNESAGFADVVTTGSVLIKTTSAVTSPNPITATKTATLPAVQFFVTHTMSANGTSSKLLELGIDRI